jgi:hypothetical protein
MSRKNYVLLLAIALVAAFAGPAHAAIETWDRGQPTTCATGAITSYDSTTDAGFFAMQAWLDACGAVPGGAAWGVVRYTTTIASAGYIAYYPGANRFTRTVGLYGRDWGNLTALCLATAPTVRLACLAITPIGGGDAALTSIPANDPRVLMPYLAHVGVDPNPQCFTCV